MMPTLLQCEDCGVRFVPGLDLTECLCGGALVPITVHGKDKPRDMSPEQVERLMRSNRGVTLA